MNVILIPSARSLRFRMTRTETFSITIYFKEPLLFITFSRECVFICFYFRMLEKNLDTLRSKEANNHRDLQIIMKLLSSRQQEQRA